MLRDELLRSKNDEIARCLLSRKRKLSELYFATVGLTENTPTDAVYRQKEQAFLDANDISKGRYFNEATLPSLPDFAALIPRPEAQPAPPEVANPVAQAQEVSPISALSKAEDVVPQTVAPSAEYQEPRSRQIIEQKPFHYVRDQVEAAIQPHPGPAAASRAAEVLDKSTALHDQLPQKTRAQVPETTPTSISYGSADVGVSPGGTDLLVGAVGPPQASSAQLLPSQKKPDHRPSLVLPRIAQDQPLSPASSVGPYSNNTPIPAPVSPDTSPAEEVAEGADKIGPVQAQPSLVPSTPDEQLRLEEAQSFQKSTLAAGKPISDSTPTNPVTKEVIQENVGPATLAGTEPLKETQKQIFVTAKEPQPSAQSQREQVQAQPGEVKAVTSTTPVSKKATSIAPPISFQPERMTTRVSSGAIRHKSVSEILGETPKPPVQVEKAHPAEKPAEAARALFGSPPDSAAKMRLKDRRAREKERSKLSTVVFPKQQQQQPQQLEKGDSMDVVRQHAGELVRLNEEQDYLFTLFQSKAYAPPRGTNLSTLLASAHKTLSTSNHLLEYQEQMDCRALRRIYALQNANRWPLRQLKRSVEPPRQGTHWDGLLDHMKWMRTDFREERKWKIAAAKSCADWCAEYVNCDPEHRALLRVPTKIYSQKFERKDAQESSMISPPEETNDEMLGLSHPTPDLVPSTEDDSVSEEFSDEIRHDLHDTVAPAAIFSLGLDEFMFSLDMTPAAQKLLDELPMYTPVKIAPETNLLMFEKPPDAAWKTELLPVSKYASGRIKFHDKEPPRKRSRYDYSQYDCDPEHGMLDLPPEQTNVALFRPENKPIRDRVHPGHSFRPPTEFPMPSVGFFESRQSSQWTYTEDDELRRLVKEYSYNWSLISSCLTPSSQFTSGADRRTPWECFERWVGMEGLPADMSKTQYFRAYHQRIETAQRTVIAHQQAVQQQIQQQQGNNNAQAQPPVRRRTTQPVRVDRRRSSKHLALLDAMRKLAKKRETILQKQQHASHLASLRKVNEANQPKPPISSPAEFSRLKYDRELKLQERQEQYRQQMIAQQRANLAAQRAGQMPNQQQMMNAPAGRVPNGMPHNPGAPGIPGATPNGMPNGMPNALPNGMPPGVGVAQGRPHIQGMPAGGPMNGPMPPNPMAMKMMSQAGMSQGPGGRPGMPMQTSPDNARVIREANRLQEQQRILQSRQQQPQPPQHQQHQAQQPPQQFHNQQQFGPQGTHSPNMNLPNVNGAPNNPAMMAALQAGGGIQSPSFPNATPQGMSTPSPRMGQPNLLSNGVNPTLNTLQNQIQRSNPNMPPEQVTKLATDRLQQYQQQRMSQVAMNAAAGNIASVQANYQIPHDGSFQASQPGMNGPGMQVPQAQGFSPMMRVSQPAQQNRMGVTNSPAMNGALPQQSRSATPQTQRSGSAQAGPVPGSSKSPNPPQAQTASG